MNMTVLSMGSQYYGSGNVLSPTRHTAVDDAMVINHPLSSSREDFNHMHHSSVEKS